MASSLLLISLAHAEPASQSQLYSELQGTHWAGTFKVNLNGNKKDAVSPLPIEISFLNQHDGNKVGYTFQKDISSVSMLQKKAFDLIDSVPCKLPDGSQEPRMITLVKNGDALVGKIDLNDCKPGKKKRPSKVAKSLPIESLTLSPDSQTLKIVVAGQKGPIKLSITYVLDRVSESELKLKK